MASRLASNGNQSGLENNGEQIKSEDIQMKSESGDMETNQADSVKAGEYVRELLKEKMALDPAQWPNAMRLVDQEVQKAQAQGAKLPRENRYVDIYREKPIRVAVKVLVPVKEHPKFNFVGKLLGPKGNSLKRLQEDTMTKMAILGRGSMRDKQKEEEFRQALDPKYAHLSDDLHVEIAALAPPAEAHARIAYALAEIRKYLVPDSNDEIRQEQMREIQAYSGPPPVERGGAAVRGRGRVPPPPPPGPRGGPPLGMRMAAPRPAPPLLPRPLPAKTKVLSILDRARQAMEESYGGYDDMGPEMGPTSGFYDSPSPGFNSGPGYGGDYNGGTAGDYYDTANYSDDIGLDAFWENRYL
ncbi:KH domain-containing, RNA-binding, signal transduction-associated protein 2-like isoform X2 [Homalodisca vitripennis]|uniref:KH domain-containing, RNA-binding, signal transduction-associated protein 2-like isoform X2 n=1 Tax=Homalodisca vitripennis TaxID=197043 RepID=UPI001EEABCA1|nr:KH domain-containing, RNA-binding, signal transduction-associated protein 2-like isoform X2 [Homalodisca vitripennis]